VLEDNDSTALVEDSPSVAGDDDESSSGNEDCSMVLVDDDSTVLIEVSPGVADGNDEVCTVVGAAPVNPVKKMLEVAPTPQLENVTVVVTSVAVKLYE